MPSLNRKKKGDIMDRWKLLVYMLLTILLSFHMMNRQQSQLPGVSVFERRMIVGRIIKDSQGQPFSIKLQREGELVSQIGEYRDLFLQESAALVDKAELEYVIVEGKQTYDKYKKRMFYFQGATVIRDEPKPQQK